MREYIVIITDDNGQAYACGPTESESEASSFAAEVNRDPELRGRVAILQTIADAREWVRA